MSEPEAPGNLAELRSQPICRLRAHVSRALEISRPGGGLGRFVEIEGGDFTGSRLRGEVLPAGGDWMFVRPDGVTELDVRTLLRTDDDALIALRYRGLRHGPPEVMASLARGERVDPSLYYFRVTSVFETDASEYDWLNKIVSVGVGRREPEGPVYDFFEIL